LTCRHGHPAGLAHPVPDHVPSCSRRAPRPSGLWRPARRLESCRRIPSTVD